MFRKLGFGSGKSKKRPKKKRLSPSAHAQERIGDDGVSVGTVPPPSYQYAMNEYALTGPSASTSRPASSANIDDEGKIRQSYSITDVEEQQHQYEGVEEEEHDYSQQQQQQDLSDGHDETMTTSNIRLHEQQQKQQERQFHNATPPPPPSLAQVPSRDGVLRSSSQFSNHNDPYNSYARRRYLSPKAEYFSYDEDDTFATDTFGGGIHREDDEDDNSTRGPSMLRPTGPSPRRGTVEQMMPDATYEEWYGDAYIGGPIRYIYPSGYQSMRPRGSPWKLSIVVCLLFTWLSVFIIDYCSVLYMQNQNDGNNNNNYYNNNNNANYNDDNFDDHVINEKWCGSRFLYWMWVISMLITGLASAYCGVIGYIKVRDFAVANTRSQPPGVMTVGDYSLSTYGESGGGNNNKGNSDYYVPIGDSSGNNSRQRHTQQTTGTNYRLQQTHPAQYSKTIYQADGTPQFWGNQIYRPNQAAVHIVSR